MVAELVQDATMDAEDARWWAAVARVSADAGDHRGTEQACISAQRATERAENILRGVSDRDLDDADRSALIRAARAARHAVRRAARRLAVLRGEW